MFHAQDFHHFTTTICWWNVLYVEHKEVASSLWPLLLATPVQCCFNVFWTMRKCNKSSFTLDSKSRWYDETLRIVSSFRSRWIIFESTYLLNFSSFSLFAIGYHILINSCFTIEEFTGKLVNEYWVVKQNVCFNTRKIGNILIIFPFQSKFALLHNKTTYTLLITNKERNHKMFAMEYKISVIIRKKAFTWKQAPPLAVFTQRRRWSNRIENVWCFQKEIKTIIIDLTHFCWYKLLEGTPEAFIYNWNFN